MTLAASRPTAKEKLEASGLNLSQLELMSGGVDLESFYLQMAGVAGADLVKAITSASIDRSIEGSSLLTVDVVDHDRKLLRSGRLHGKQDVKIDGLWFRLSAVGKQGDTISLTFEDREIAVLRTYDTIIKQSAGTSRTAITRAEFILRLLKEVKEFPIRYVIPELHKIQPIEKTADTSSQFEMPVNNRDKGYGIPAGLDLTVKGAPMNAKQRTIANIVLQTGMSPPRVRKALVISMMVAIQENSLNNSTSPDNPDHHGVFQQDPAYWPASGDVATDAAAFFRSLDKAIAAHPNAAYFQIAEAVQASGNAQAYAQWRTEAERIVTAFGVLSTSSADVNNQYNFSGGQGDYEFYRGEPPTNGFSKWQKENSWDCIQRLASEVNWRAFFVSGVFYYMYEDELFKTKPVMVIDEDTLGVEAIDGNLTPNKRASHRGYEYENAGSATISCRLGRWQAPPGSVVQFVNMGPWDGRWLVSSVQRSLFDSLGTIELKKPLPKLPEPGGSNLPQSQGGDWTTPGTTPSVKKKQYPVGTAVVQPVPKCEGKKTSDQGTHDTAGLAGYPAIDFMGDPGAAVVAPASGKVIKISGHPTSAGAVEGPGGPFGRSVYIETPGGTVIYMTHLGDDVKVVVGEEVSAGELIGTIGDYPGGTPDHVHIGVNPGSDGITVHTIAQSPQASC